MRDRGDGTVPRRSRGQPDDERDHRAGCLRGGDAAAMLQGAIMAASSGATAASFANHTLVTEDVEAELAAAPAAQHELGRTS